jgi:hypothetical protein
MFIKISIYTFNLVELINQLKKKKEFIQFNEVVSMKQADLDFSNLYFVS